MIVSLLLSFCCCCCCVFPRWFSSLFLISCCAPLLYWFPPLSSSHTCFCPLLLLVFFYASAFNQDLSSWNVGEVTTMQHSESSVRSLLLLLLLLVGRGVLSSVYTSLSSPSLSCCGVLPLLVSPPLSLPLLSHWSPPPPPPPSVSICLRLQPGPVLVERRQGHDHVWQ